MYTAIFIAFDILTAVNLKIYTFWDIMLSSTLKVLLLASCWLFGLFFDPENGGDIFLKNIF
jgi:hypothetical protein